MELRSLTKESRAKPLAGKNTRQDHQHARIQIPICRSDAAWDKYSNKVGLAWIISDSTNSTIKQGATPQVFVNSPIIAEALALQLGLIAAVNLGLSRIKMLSDNSTLIRAINNDMHSKEIFGILNVIHKNLCFRRYIFLFSLLSAKPSSRLLD